MGDPLLSGLAGLTKGIFAGIEARKKGERADKELELKERHITAREEYLRQRQEETDVLSELKGKKLEADIAKSQVQTEAIGVEQVSKAQQDIKKTAEKLTELDSMSSRLQKRLERQTDPAQQAKIQEQLGAVQAERDALTQSMKLSEQRVTKKTGTEFGEVEPKARPVFNALRSAPSAETLKQIGGQLDQADYSPKTWEKLKQEYKRKLMEIRSGGRSLIDEEMMQEEAPIPTEE